VLLARLAELDAGAGHPDRTLRTLHRLRRTHPREPSVVAALARQHLATGDVDAAESVLASWPEDVPAGPTIEALRGECCRRREQPEQAIVHLARALASELDPRAYRCRACGEPATEWRPRCMRCGRWDTVAGEADARDVAASATLMPSPSGSTATDHCVTEIPG
jgi:hypothetical protein